MKLPVGLKTVSVACLAAATLVSSAPIGNSVNQVLSQDDFHPTVVDHPTFIEHAPAPAPARAPYHEDGHRHDEHEHDEHDHDEHKHDEHKDVHEEPKDFHHGDGKATAIDSFNDLQNGPSVTQIFCRKEANGYGGSSWQWQQNKPVVSGGGNSVTAGGPQDADNSGSGGSIGGKGGEGGRANGYGGHSWQGQSNAPVVSGWGNSVTAGGAQGAENSGKGGQIGGEEGGHGGGGDKEANGYGGSSWQWEQNTPAVSGFGNSVTAGGPQSANNGGSGGHIGDEEEGGHGGRSGYGRRSFSRRGGGGGEANSYGGSSWQYQYNAPAVSGYGNSVTAGGGQQADNSGKGGQFGGEEGGHGGYHRRGFGGQPQGHSDNNQQSIGQFASVDAFGGKSFQAGINGDAVADNSATTGLINQSASNSVNKEGQKAAGHKGAFHARQFGGQGASANAYSGNSVDFQNNVGQPISGNGKHVTIGGPQISDNSAIGGIVGQEQGGEHRHGRPIQASKPGHGGHGNVHFAKSDEHDIQHAEVH